MTTTWRPHENIPLDEKIRRTKRAILELSAYDGAIAQAVVKNKKMLLAELEKQREQA